MSWEIAWVFAVAVIALVLFITERLPIDQVAIGVPILLLLGGALTPEQAISGLSNEATVTVAAVLVLGLGLSRTGAVDVVAQWARVAPLGSPRLRVIILCILAGAASAFLNNTAVVAVLIPVFIGVAASAGLPNSAVLMPLSFSAILGGTITLIGTSTNLVVHGMALNRGLDDLTMFSIAPLGLVYFGVGFVYLFTAGTWLLPRRETAPGLADRYEVRRYETELTVGEDTVGLGDTPANLGWEERFDVELLALVREGRRGPLHPRYTPLIVGDRVIVSGDSDAILRLADHASLQTPGERLEDEVRPDPDDGLLAEVLVAPGSFLEGRSLRELHFRQTHDVVVLGIQRHGRAIPSRIGSTRLAVGDLLLLHGRADALDAIADHPGLVPLGARTGPRLPRRAWLAVAILAAVIATTALGVTSILAAAMVGAVAMIFTRCLSLGDLYEGLDWSVIALLAGLLPLGLALDETGGATLLAEQVASLLGGASPMVIIGAFYLFTSLLTEVMSNAAAAVVLTPIALEAAGPLGLDPYAMVVAVMFGCSASFMTPMGYQTNAMIYGPGGYRFSDYLRVGLPLNLLLVVTAAVAIPLLWPSPG